MKITLLGAAGGEVTGSCYLVETGSAAVLIDCGAFQGGRKAQALNKLPQRGAMLRLSAVLLTHAHLDHTGRLPLLSQLGYRGPIYATPASIELTELILQDSAKVHKSDIDQENRFRAKRRQPPIEPNFTSRDVERLSQLYTPVRYDSPTEVAPGITARWIEAGHIFGSASIELTVNESGREKTVIFSGDLGPRGAPLHKDPVPFKHADAVFLESTYGDRDHKTLEATLAEGTQAVQTAAARKGIILVPAFAIGRTQLLLYLLAGAFQRKLLTPFPIYVDSPMAIKATKIYAKHPELFDETALALLKSGELATQLKTVDYVATATESRRLKGASGPCLIMAGSGMCTGGRIMHHLENHLSKSNTTVIIVGFQSSGSLGRSLVDRKPYVTIRGRRIPVNASIATLGGLSGHAGQTDLLRWFEPLAASKPQVFLTHGEDKPRGALRDLIQSRHGIRAALPALQEVVEI